LSKRLLDEMSRPLC